MPLPQVTADNYTELAIRTEAPVTGDLLGRFQNRENLLTFLRYTIKAIYYARCLDLFKKHFFYGRQVIGQTNFIAAETIDLPQLNPITVDQAAEALLKTENVRLLHAVLGAATEAGELLEALVVPFLNGTDVDVVNLAEERGDTNWYVNGILGDVLGETLRENLTTNIHKLAERYGDKFSEFAANNRDLDSERQILEAFPLTPVTEEHAFQMGYEDGKSQPLNEEFNSGITFRSDYPNAADLNEAYDRGVNKGLTEIGHLGTSDGSETPHTIVTGRYSSDFKSLPSNKHFDPETRKVIEGDVSEVLSAEEN